MTQKKQKYSVGCKHEGVALWQTINKTDTGVKPELEIMPDLL